MKSLFGVDLRGGHPCAGVDGATCAASQRPALANLAHDHRVGGRAKAFLGLPGGAPKSGAELVERLSEFHRDRIQGSRRPSFQRRPNAPNQVPHPSGDLCRLVGLEGLFRSALFARHAGAAPPAVIGEPATWDRGGIVSWITATAVASDSARRALVRHLLTWAGRTIASAPYHPAWCTRWDSLPPGPPDLLRLRGALGLADTGPRTVVLLRYRLPAGQRLYRPTVLDAGPFWAHYPSPPALVCSEGGRTMGIPDPDPSGPLPEYIHTAIPHSMAHWDAAGAAWAVLPPNWDDTSAPQGPRLAHAAQLAHEWPGSSSWMCDPMSC